LFGNLFKMDVSLLRNRIQSTVDPNADTRRQAELDLKYVRSSKRAGQIFSDYCLYRQKSSQALPMHSSKYCRPSRTIAYASRVHKLLHPLDHIADAVTAVVYLKNRVNRAWQPSDDSVAQKQIPEEEKLDLRNRLLPILASSSPQIRSQIIPILQKILSYDFPAKWPDFLDMTMQLLSTNHANSVFAGLHCMLAICRMYRFKGVDTRPEFNQIVEASFPQLLAIATRLVEETSVEAWEMLHIIMKAYKHAIYVGQIPIILVSCRAKSPSSTYHLTL